MSELLNLVGRTDKLFSADLAQRSEDMKRLISASSFLVLGAGGSIGQAVTREIFSRNPAVLHAIDLSENGLAELVRDLRSSIGYTSGDFRTAALDIDTPEFDAFFRANGPYDYVLNLSALKHVRSERDPFTLMRMLVVNILNTEKTILQAINTGAKKYFCVSTDKAANPVNLMGASKRVMELGLSKYGGDLPISTARFANVAFSNGSLLQSFVFRIEKEQPIAAPRDISRYFVSSEEAGELCLMSCLFGETNEIFFPKLDEDAHKIAMAEVATNFLRSRNLKPLLCSSEAEARDLMTGRPQGSWPCFFHDSDTSGEKSLEEFFTSGEDVDLEKFRDIGVITQILESSATTFAEFTDAVRAMRSRSDWSKAEILSLFESVLPEFGHIDRGLSLDDRM